MREKSYKNLIDPWKSMFDLCAATKSDHLDLNEFKLFYNEKLLESFLADQANNQMRGFSEYGEIAESIYNKAQLDFYRKVENVLSFESIKNAILLSDYVYFNYQKEDNGGRYLNIVIKLIISTIHLSQSEMTFISSVIHTKIDDESSTAAIAVATLPTMKKSINHEKLERWAKLTVLKHFHQSTPNDETHILQLGLKESIQYCGLNLYARYGI